MGRCSWGLRFLFGNEHAGIAAATQYLLRRFRVYALDSTLNP